MQGHARSLAIGSILAFSVLLAGCSATPEGVPDAVAEPSSTHTQDGQGAAETTETHQYFVAAAKVAAVSVNESPDGPVVQQFMHPQPSGAPLTFLVKDRADDWLEVYLPTRPNGATGWIMAGAVDVQQLQYRLEVSTTNNELELFEGDELLRTYAVATGTGGTPTPHGTFYLTELMAPTNEGYGPYAYGLSGFSEVLTEFLGGPGQIGLHGTDDEGSIGSAASHGCIRMGNDDITELAEMLPLGTPILIAE